MPIIQENPTYFSDKSAAAVVVLNSSRIQHFRSTLSHPREESRCNGTSRKLSMTSYDDSIGGGDESFSEMETFLSSCESGNSYCAPETKIIRNNSYLSCKSSGERKFSYNSLTRRKPKKNGVEACPDPSSSSGIGSLGRLSQLFKKSKSKSSVGSESQSTVESSGIGSPTICTPDSSLSIYTNSLDGDSHSSTNSNQISPKLLGNREDPMDDNNRYCSTYTFDDCGIFAANMYYNVGESSVFTIYHPNNQTNTKNANNSKRAIMESGNSEKFRDDDEFEDCVQPYYNASFSTFSNPKRCSVASAASTTTSSIVPVSVNKSKNNGASSNAPILQDRDGYLKPNEPTCNLRNVKHLYINDAVIAAANNGKSGVSGQVQQVQVDVHTPTTKENPGSRLAYHFDSAGSTASQGTTLVAGGSNFGLPEGDEVYYGDNGIGKRRRNRTAPIYMNKAYFGSNSIGSSSAGSSESGRSSKSSSRRIGNGGIFSAVVASDCEPYCSLCSSSIMGSPRKQSKMDVVIVKCKECFFSREAESHIRGFFDKLMTEDKQKMDVTLKSYDLKDLDHPADRVVVHCAKVQIVIISHHFLQRLKDEASRKPRLSPINRVFRSKNVISVLLKVTEQEVLEGYEAVLPRFNEWYSVDLRSSNKYDPEFCKKFTEQVVRIYNVELSNSSSFSVFPKKVTRDQPKVAIVFKKPVSQDDEVRIELRTQRQTVALTEVKLENPHTILLRIPDNLSPDREALVDVSVFINKHKIGGSRIKSELNLKRMDDDEVDRMGKMLPSFLDWLDKHIANTLQKHYKDCTDYTRDPELELMNGIIISKADLLPTIMHFAAFYGLSQTAFIVLEEADGLVHCNLKNEVEQNPADIAFSRGHNKIGQMIRDYQEISNSYKAYRYVKELMEKDPKSFENNEEGNGSEDETERSYGQRRADSEDLLEEGTESIEENQDVKDHSPSPSDVSLPGRNEVKQEAVQPKRTPTPSIRRKLPTPQQYVNVRGNDDDNPERVETRAKKNPISPQTARKRLTIMQNYDIPRTLDEDYKLPPSEIRPVQKKEQDGLTAPVFVSKNNNHHVTESGYLMIMTEEEEESVDEHKNLKENKPDGYQEVQSAAPMIDYNSPLNTSSRKQSLEQKNSMENLKVHPKLSNGRNDAKIKLDPADEQLIDLMNDFKNNTIDIRMLELLFENWKQCPDVQKSMEERVKMLDQLREDYRKWKQQSTRKKSSALGRIKFWKRKKSSNTSPNEMTQQTAETVSNSTVTSPTGLTFTGPNLVSSAFSSSSLPTSPPPTLEANIDFRASESSYRISYDSRFSDSSADSDKPESTHSSNSGNSKIAPPQTPLEYRNPGFVNLPAPSQSSPDQPEGTSRKSTENISYQVPPPPRPVKPLRLSPPDTLDELKVSPKPPRKPPVIPIPEEHVLPSPGLKRKPPPIPEKPNEQDLDTNDEISSPPPLPPPRANNTQQLFSYIDYRKKNQIAGGENAESVKQSYENMTEGGQQKS